MLSTTNMLAAGFVTLLALTVFAARMRPSKTIESEMQNHAFARYFDGNEWVHIPTSGFHISPETMASIAHSRGYLYVKKEIRIGMFNPIYVFARMYETNPPRPVDENIELSFKATFADGGRTIHIEPNDPWPPFSRILSIANSYQLVFSGANQRTFGALDLHFAPNNPPPPLPIPAR